MILFPVKIKLALHQNHINLKTPSATETNYNRNKQAIY